MPDRTILCHFTDLSHLPPPYGKRGKVHSGWKLLPWHCRRSESGWLGLNFNHQMPALPCGKEEFTGVIAELLLERDLQKMSLSSYIDLRKLKDINMKVEWWKKDIPWSRFLHEGSPEGKTGGFFMSFNALFSVLLKEYWSWKFFPLFTILIVIGVVLCGWESFCGGKVFPRGCCCSACLGCSKFAFRNIVQPFHWRHSQFQSCQICIFVWGKIIVHIILLILSTGQFVWSICLGQWINILILSSDGAG